MTMLVALTLNGKTVSTDVEPRTLLVQLIRDHFGLTGTHVGCDTSQCGGLCGSYKWTVGKKLHDAGSAGRGDGG